MKAYFKGFAESPATYPLATLMISSIIASLCVGFELVTRPTALVALAIWAFLLAVISYHRLALAIRDDVGVVHGLVNSQHDDLIARIDQLTKLLTELGIPIPHDPSIEKANDG